MKILKNFWKNVSFTFLFDHCFGASKSFGLGVRLTWWFDDDDELWDERSLTLKIALLFINLEFDWDWSTFYVGEEE